MKVTQPNLKDIIKIRTSVQKEKGFGITEAQKHCADLVYAGLRTWQQWETGDRKMKPAFFELINLKLNKNICKADVTSGKDKRMLEDLSVQNYRVESLSMLVKKLVHSMRKNSEHNEKLANEAIDYLRDNELIGSPLR